MNKNTKHPVGTMQDLPLVKRLSWVQTVAEVRYIP
jgi:hypothetical protein